MSKHVSLLLQITSNSVFVSLLFVQKQRSTLRGRRLGQGARARRSGKALGRASRRRRLGQGASVQALRRSCWRSVVQSASSGEDWLSLAEERRNFPSARLVALLGDGGLVLLGARGGREEPCQKQMGAWRVPDEAPVQPYVVQAGERLVVRE